LELKIRSTVRLSWAATLEQNNGRAKAQTKERETNIETLRTGIGVATGSAQSYEKAQLKVTLGQNVRHTAGLDSCLAKPANLRQQAHDRAQGAGLLEFGS